MALTTCPDCGREVSTLAEACPQCGHPFTPQHAETPKTEVSRSAVASLVFSLLWLGGVGSILGVGFGHYSLRQIRRSGRRLQGPDGHWTGSENLTIGGHGIAMAGTVLGYVGIVGTVAVVLITAYVLGEEINTTFDAQASETPTSVVASTTTTTTAALSFWAVPDEEAAQAWAEGAIEYVESLNRTWDDREAAINSNIERALGVCRQLVGSDLFDIDAALPPDERFPGDISFYIRSPAQVEADMRERLGVERWELYGAVWYESLVFGLCVR